MKYEEQFSTEQFKNLYKLSKNIIDKKDSNRNLDDNINDKKTIVKEKLSLDIQNAGGVKVLYKLINNIGLNVESMKPCKN